MILFATLETRKPFMDENVTLTFILLVTRVSQSLKHFLALLVQGTFEKGLGFCCIPTYESNSL